MTKKRRNRKPQAARNRRPTTSETPENQARTMCGQLLRAAAQQARRGEPRLLAEILAYLKPTPRPVYILPALTQEGPPGYADLDKPSA